MTPERWAFLSDYAEEVFGSEDEGLAGLTSRANQRGLPSVSVTADVGRFLKILVSMTSGKLAIELGTLAGYSAIWIARGLAADGKLISIEYDDTHAAFAEAEIARAGLVDRIEVIRGAALDVLPGLRETLPPESVDFVFIDAVKDEYIAYFEALKPMVAVGGLVVADNVFGIGKGWIDEGYGTDDFNRHVAADSDFDTTVTPMRSGLLIARRVS
jgi:predicted O-methyltransferase YrrM